MSSLDGLVAIVTGGASGIGAAVVSRLAEEGASVACLDVHEGTADGSFLSVRVDVTDARSVDAAVAQVEDRFGRLDIVVNSAGIGAQGTVEAFDQEEWLRVLDVNVLGVARVCKAALPLLQRSPSASIVNIASVVADIGLPQRALYSASKGAIAALTRAMAADHLHEGVRVNAVSPGTAATPWVERLLGNAADSDRARAELESRQPHGRLVSAREVADAVLYFASPGAGSTTGAILPVDGGLLAVRHPRA